jgi:hypothetical protein
MAFRMQTSVPELTDLSKRAESTFEMYGEDAASPGTFAYNCLLARRLAERGVRFMQLFIAAGTSTATCRSRACEAVPDTDQARPRWSRT